MEDFGVVFFYIINRFITLAIYIKWCYFCWSGCWRVEINKEIRERNRDMANMVKRFEN